MPAQSNASDGTGYQDYLAIAYGLPGFFSDAPSTAWYDLRPYGGTNFPRVIRHLEGTTFSPVAHSEMGSPASMMLWMDAGGEADPTLSGNAWDDVARQSPGGDPYPAPFDRTVWSPSPSFINGFFVTPRHVGNSRALFVDGHVEALTGLDDPLDFSFYHIFNRNLGHPFAWYWPD